MSDSRLTTKQQAFVSAYLGEARFNATKAAQIAGYKDPEQAGYENKRKQEIRARIDEFLAERAMSAAEVLSELADIATADWREFLTFKTDPRTGDTIDVKMDLSNKVKSLELIGKHYHLFTDKIDIKHSGNVNHTLTHDLSRLSDDELALLEALAEKIEAGEVVG